jgi:SPP1 gp7 family putative phage head morphogenesis protein
MNDFHTDYLMNHLRIEGLSNHLAYELEQVLYGSIEELTGKIAVLSLKADKTLSLIRKKTYLVKQKVEVEKVLNEIYGKIGSEIKTSISSIAENSPLMIRKIITKNIPPEMKISLSVPHLSSSTVKTWVESFQIEGLFFNEWINKLETGARDRILKASMNSLINGYSNKETIKSLSNALKVSTHSIQGLIQTASYQAKNWGELQFCKGNSKSIKAVRYVAELDRQTCPQCVPKDGLEFPLDKAPIPPIHFRCRCYLVCVFKNEIFNNILNEDRRIARLYTDKRKVHHRDGTTSTNYRKFDVQHPQWKMNYKQWMESLVKSSNPVHLKFAKEALGASRFNLLKAGKININQVYYSGKLRTVKQLMELI